jgi:hypothetical protein
LGILNNPVLTLISGLLAAFVTVGGTWWKEAAQRRSGEQTRQRALTYIKDEVGIIEAWAKAYASLESSAEPPARVRERAYRDLDAAYDRMKQLAPGLQQSSTFRAVLLRLLLRNLPATLAVRLLRYVYYFTLFMAVIWAFVGFSQPDSWSTGTAIIITFMTYLTVAVAPPWIVARLAIFVARRWGAKRP